MDNNMNELELIMEVISPPHNNSVTACGGKLILSGTDYGVYQIIYDPHHVVQQQKKPTVQEVFTNSKLAAIRFLRLKETYNTFLKE